MRVLNWLSKLSRSLAAFFKRHGLFAATALQFHRRRNLQAAGSIAISTLLLPFVAPTSADELFDLPVYSLTGNFPADCSAASADFNGDGITDLITGSCETRQINIQLGTGNGKFGQPSLIFEGEFNGSTDVTTSDFNGDGLVDLAATSQGRSILVSQGQGDGTFGKPEIFDLCTECSKYSFGTAHSITAADFNGDGHPDIAVTLNPGNLTVYSYEVSILVGKGDGTFEQDQIFEVGRNPAAVTAADFNGDGLDDLAVAALNETYYVSEVAVFMGNADTILTAGQRIAAESNVLTHGDFNGDGITDLAMASNKLCVGFGNGDGTFADIQSFAFPGLARGITSDDYNGDGVADVAITVNEDSVSVLLGNGDKTFEDQFVIPLNLSPFGIVSDDFNGDGAVDLATVLVSFPGSVAVILNRNCGPILLGDVNLDGVVDLLDVSPFVELLAAGKFQVEADINEDGMVNLLDVAPFVRLLN